MNAAVAIELIATAARYAQLALQIKADAAPFIALVVKWSSQEAEFDPTDLDAMNKAAQPLFARLNDTSRDVK